MMDPAYLYNKQISEFLFEYKTRFTQITHMNMPGKCCYQTKLNRNDVNANMNIYLTERFPMEVPLVYIIPKFNHECLDQNGRVFDECLRMWNFNSSLKNIAGILLAKFEYSGRQIVNNTGNTEINQIISSSNTEDDLILAELSKDLNSRSIDELIFINFNPDDYVYEFTQKQRNNNFNLLQEVNSLSDTAEKLKTQYDEVKNVIDEYRHQYEEKEKELRDVYNQKQLLDSKFTVEKLIEEMKSNIDENYQKPRQKLITEFLSKKIEFETFKENFKDLSLKFHYYSIIKDKMNLYK